MEALTWHGRKRILVENGLCLKMDFNRKLEKTLFRGSVGYSSSISEFSIKFVDSKGITCEKQVFYSFDFFLLLECIWFPSARRFIGYLCFFFGVHNDTLDIWITTILITYCDSWTVSTYHNFILNTNHVIVFRAFSLHF